ncbi:MAG: hypothetical protein ACKVQT_28880 [Burkholderiales bacterium]
MRLILHAGYLARTEAGFDESHVVDDAPLQRIAGAPGWPWLG